MPTTSRARRAIRLRASLPMLLAISLHACSDGSPGNPSESSAPLDSTPAPADPAPPPATDSLPPPPDTTTPPPPDSAPPPPPDSSAPPPYSRCTFPGGASSTPHHVGIAFGPTHVPPAKFGSFTGTQITATHSACLLADLEKARRASARVFISFTGNSQWNRDENGFSLTKWKQRVDRFRDVDLTPYIADGTILGHLVLDEPNDPHEWNGNTVSLADIEEMARYSKEVWPTMTTFVRAFPDYLKGGRFPHLDALWFQYLDRWAPLDQFIAKHFKEAESLGLKVVTGLNVINGGSKSSGIPGRRRGKNAMSADEVRAWGGALLGQSNLCAFLLWEYDEAYLARPDIAPALEDLAAKARSYPTGDCRR
ncbi:MAG TPA: hypothetical protein VFT28_07470 [Gemmatimonadales bacterium]|nr:hypothetical protein [Gemmatimonadales bacterium]